MTGETLNHWPESMVTTNYGPAPITTSAQQKTDISMSILPTGHQSGYCGVEIVRWKKPCGDGVLKGMNPTRKQWLS